MLETRTGEHTGDQARRGQLPQGQNCSKAQRLKLVRYMCVHRLLAVNISNPHGAFSLDRTNAFTLKKLNTHKYQVPGCHRGSVTAPFPTRVKPPPHSFLNELSDIFILQQTRGDGKTFGGLFLKRPPSQGLPKRSGVILHTVGRLFQKP